MTRTFGQSPKLGSHNDREVGVVKHVFAADAERTLEEFRTELNAAAFDARRLQLD